MRGQLLIPVLQITGVVATLRLLRRWRLDPEQPPEPWTHVGAAYPASADPKSVDGPHPDSHAEQNARLSDALHARLFLDRDGLRQLCAGVELFATGLVLRALRGSSSPQRSSSDRSNGELSIRRSIRQFE